MKRTALVMAAFAVAMAGFGAALADVAPATMQPIANPPEKPMKSHGHMAKHHKHMAKHHNKASAKATPEAGAH
jgi:hypothetical protein